MASSRWAKSFAASSPRWASGVRMPAIAACSMISTGMFTARRRMREVVWRNDSTISISSSPTATRPVPRVMRAFAVAFSIR